ncbi:transposase [Robiginitomaculum antarcticum]|nr:transposase [Robiginitomaculum antarcticum]
MTGQRQIFTKAFRRVAVHLSRESTCTVRDIAEDLGMALSTLSRWRV